MAANLQGRRIAGFGKRFMTQIRTTNSPDPTHLRRPPHPALISRRATHDSAYEKNLDDHVHQAIVPDDVVEPQSDKYWGPHPHTGVFGPTTEHTSLPATGTNSGSGGGGGGESAMEHKAWFRPLEVEDLEKPHQRAAGEA